MREEAVMIYVGLEGLTYEGCVDESRLRFRMKFIMRKELVQKQEKWIIEKMTNRNVEDYSEYLLVKRLNNKGIMERNEL